MASKKFPSRAKVSGLGRSWAATQFARAIGRARDRGETNEPKERVESIVWLIRHKSARTETDSYGPPPGG